MSRNPFFSSRRTSSLNFIYIFVLSYTRLCAQRYAYPAQKCAPIRLIHCTELDAHFWVGVTLLLGYLDFSQDFSDLFVPTTCQSLGPLTEQPATKYAAPDGLLKTSGLFTS